MSKNHRYDITVLVFHIVIDPLKQIILNKENEKAIVDLVRRLSNDVLNDQIATIHSDINERSK